MRVLCLVEVSTVGEGSQQSGNNSLWMRLGRAGGSTEKAALGPRVTQRRTVPALPLPALGSSLRPRPATCPRPSLATLGGSRAETTTSL